MNWAGGMIIVLKAGASDGEVRGVIERIEQMGLKAHVSRGEFRTIIGAIGDEAKLRPESVAVLAGVESVMPIMKPYKLASRDFHAEDTVVEVRGRKIGGKHLAVIAGPCSVESEEQVRLVAKRVAAAGAAFLRGGAFKPRTSPYTFQGMGLEGLKILRDVSQETGLPVVTEVMDARQMELVAEYADVLQVGARNMQNYALLTEVGHSEKPVLLKRGPGAIQACMDRAGIYERMKSERAYGAWKECERIYQSDPELYREARPRIEEALSRLGPGR